MTIMECVLEVLDSETNEFTNWTAFGRSIGMSGRYLKRLKTRELETVSTATAQKILDKFNYNLELIKRV